MCWLGSPQACLLVLLTWVPKERLKKSRMAKAVARVQQNKVQHQQQEIQCNITHHHPNQGHKELGEKDGCAEYSSLWLDCNRFVLVVTGAEIVFQLPSETQTVRSRYSNISGHFSIFLKIWTWSASYQTKRSVRDQTEDSGSLSNNFFLYAYCSARFINYYPQIFILFFSVDTYSYWFGLPDPLGETTCCKLLLE